MARQTVHRVQGPGRFGRGALDRLHARRRRALPGDPAGPAKSFELTGRGNTVAVLTDGSAVLGLGNIGPETGMPVMEGIVIVNRTGRGAKEG